MINPQPKPTRKERVRKRLTRRPYLPQKLTKPQPWRCAEFRRFVASHACALCGKQPGNPFNPVVSAHWGSHGLSLKASDFQIAPLCTEPCHRLQGAVTALEFRDRYHVNLVEVSFWLLVAWLEIKYREAEIDS